MQERRASASAFFVAILFNLLSIRNVLQHIPEEHKRGEVLKPRYKYTGRGIMTPTQAAPMFFDYDRQREDRLLWFEEVGHEASLYSAS